MEEVAHGGDRPRARAAGRRHVLKDKRALRTRTVDRPSRAVWLLCLFVCCCCSSKQGPSSLKISKTPRNPKDGGGVLKGSDQEVRGRRHQSARQENQRGQSCHRACRDAVVLDPHSNRSSRPTVSCSSLFTQAQITSKYLPEPAPPKPRPPKDLPPPPPPPPQQQRKEESGGGGGGGFSLKIPEVKLPKVASPPPKPEPPKTPPPPKAPAFSAPKIALPKVTLPSPPAVDEEALAEKKRQQQTAAEAKREAAEEKRRRTEAAAEAKREAAEAKRRELEETKLAAQKAAEERRREAEAKRLEEQERKEAAARARKEAEEERKEALERAAAAKRQELEERKAAAAEERQRKMEERMAAAEARKQQQQRASPPPPPPPPKAEAPRPTFGFGLNRPPATVVEEDQPKLLTKAPRGVPTIANWEQNRDGSVTGFIKGSFSFGEGDGVTTSPIAGPVQEGTVVTTASGSQ